MQISELARRTGTSTKAVRYYEHLGLLAPARLGNGYRDYSDEHVQIVEEIRALAAIGISPSKAGPFVECLRHGHERSDECPESLAAYRDSIAVLDDTIASLTHKRQVLTARLNDAACRKFDEESRPMTEFTSLPAGLPEPVDDGAADHLVGLPIPDITLAGSGGERRAAQPACGTHDHLPVPAHRPSRSRSPRGLGRDSRCARVYTRGVRIP